MEHLTIKQIANLSGVSAGTVDRVLHNRGKVSPEAMEAVNKVLASRAYKYNLHTSAVAFKKTKKTLKIVVAIPSSDQGEYWDMIRSGIEEAFSEYSDYSIERKFVFFEPFDSISCRKAFESIADSDYSAYIIANVFIEETKALCFRLDSRRIPYVFVDGSIEGTSPIASFRADQNACGQLLARLMDGLTPQGKELALLLPKRKGTQLSNNSIIRKSSFMSYFARSGKERIIKESLFSTSASDQTRSEVQAFLSDNPNVGGIAVVISSCYLISDALKASGIDDIIVGGFDVTSGNLRCVNEESLDFLIDQHPDRQGFYAVESMLHFLLYGAPDSTLREIIPIDIVFKENLPQ